MTLREEIINYIREHSKARPDDLEENLNFGRAAIYRNLKKLVANGILFKHGKAPRVLYTLIKDSLENDLRRALRKDPSIISAYVLGSTITGQTNQESDFDLAVVVNKKVAGSDIYALIRDISFPKDLDLSIVERESSPLFLFQIVSKGKRIYEKDRSQAIAFEDFALDNYYDTAYLRKLNYSYLRRRFLYADK